MSWVDEYGIRRAHGRDETEGSNNAAPVTTFGAMRQVVIDIDYDENGLPTLEHAAKVPAKGCVYDAVMVVRTASAQAATINVGTYRKDGTVIDEDGLLAGSSVNATGFVQGEGVLIDKLVDEDSFIKVTSSSSAAALKGLKACIVIEYI